MGWPGRAQSPRTTAEPDGEASKLKELTMHTHQQSSQPVATISLDIGKNTFHLVGLDRRGAIVMRTKVSRNQLVRSLVNLPSCLLGLEAGSGSHHIARHIQSLGHDVRLIPAQYVKPFLKGHKNDYRDAEAIAEAVQRPTMNFVAIKTPEQSDLLSLHRVRSRLVRQRTAIINQIRGILIERGITVRQGPGPLRKVLPEILSSPPDALSPRLVRLIAELDEDWRRLETSADGKTVTIKLRPGVKFHDGEPFDAAAAKFTLDRHMMKPGSFRKAELAQVDKVEVVDPLTIHLLLKAPFSPLIAQLTDRAGMM